jgi:hypothetical protein
VHGIADTAALATKTYADTAVSTHSSDTTSVHGITDTAELATKTYADNSVSTHSSDTTSIHGIADTAELATKTYADAAVSTHSSDTTDVHGITDTAQLSTKTYADTAVSTHSSDTTEVHGIADTSILVTTTGTQTLTNKTITTPAGLVKSDVGLGNVDNTSDASKPVSTAQQTALDLKADLANPTFTGTVAGITKTHVGLGNVDNTADASKPVSTAQQTALDLKANLADPTFTGTVVLPSTTSVGDVSATELGYVNGVTSAIQTQLDDKLSKTGGTMTGAITLSGAPTESLHPATKAYVDSAVEGLHVHPSVKAATTEDVNLSSQVEAGDILDGVTLAHNDRILVKNQSTASENGIYIVQPNGAPTRATDFDTAAEVDSGDFVFVDQGTTQANSGWVQINTPATIGTDAIAFVQFSGAGTYLAGSALTLTGNTFSIADGAITSAKIADGTIVDGDINASAEIAQSKISGLSTSLSEKAPLASPTFTGTVTVAASGVAFTDGTQTTIVQKTASYTLSTLTHRDSMIEVDSTSGTTITIPTDATLNYPIGTTIDILQTNTGQVTIAAVTPGTTTVNSTPGLKLRTRWSSCTLMKRAANTWVVFGDLTA